MITGRDGVGVGVGVVDGDGDGVASGVVVGVASAELPEPDPPESPPVVLPVSVVEPPDPLRDVLPGSVELPEPVPE